ncbi:MAG: TatD family hydrolase [Gilvibacter sp.]
MIFTDTHTHLYSEAFDEDRDQIINKAMDLGITRFFIPAIDSGYNQRMFDLEAAYPNNVFLMMGLHPTSVKENFKEELAIVDALFAERSFYAVGEIGIDLYWDKTTLAIQQEAFVHQIRLAKKYELPIVIHCREAFDEIFEVLEGERDDRLRGIFHCFTGNLAQAKRAIGFNMKLGIGGVVTFKNGGLDKFIDQIDMSHLVLETDAPYLTPTPHRGKRNEASYLRLVSAKLADLFGVSESEIAKVTTANSKEVFGI